MTNAIHHQWNFESTITSLAVNRKGDWVAAALGDGSVRLFATHDMLAKPVGLAVHEGISLSLQPDADAHGFISGGDDGKVVLIDPVPASATVLWDGAVAIAGREQGGRTAEPSRAQKNLPWVDLVAGSADGKYRAFNVGKKIYVLDEEGKEKFAEPLMMPSHPGGLCFSPNGKRLAISHYNGVSLVWMNAKSSEATKLEWKGSHLDVVWTPDGKSVLTSLQENALHGWQLADGKEMRMQGYASKIRSMAFSARGKFLVTSGADQIICWPFSGGGPWGKPPVTLGGRDFSALRASETTRGGSDNRLVTQVAPHPKDEMIAAGYNDGMVVLAPLDGRMEIMIAPPSSKDKATITGLVWNQAGDALYGASEAGTVMLFTLDSVRQAVVAR